MPQIELGLPIDKRQGFIIRMCHKGLWLEVATLMDKSLDNGIKLFVISGVVEFVVTQRFIKVGLVEDHPMPTPFTSHSTSKGR